MKEKNKILEAIENDILEYAGLAAIGCMMIWEKFRCIGLTEEEIADRRYDQQKKSMGFSKKQIEDFRKWENIRRAEAERTATERKDKADE